MHEMALAEGVLQLIEQSAGRERFSKVLAVWLEVGQLAGVEAEAMRFCFDAVVRGTIAENAKLEIVAAPGAGWCMQCERTVALAQLYGACPECGSFEVQVTGGTELRVRELEVG